MSMLSSVLLSVTFLHAFLINYAGSDMDAENFREASNRLIDWSDTCKENDELTLLLTMGMGVSDAVVIMITKNEQNPNCEITVFTLKGVYLIIVIEFPDKHKGYNACQDNTSHVLVYDTLHEDEPISACQEVNQNKDGNYGMHFITKEPNATIVISSKTSFETIKITATSGRQLEQHESCSTGTEHSCKIKDMQNEMIDTCVSVEVVCDGHNNCAKPNDFDEDPRICQVSRFKMLWLVVVATLIMVALGVFFFVRLLCSCMPRIGDSFFIFNEDEDNKLNLASIFIPPQSRPPPMIKTIASVPSRSSSYRIRTLALTEATQHTEERRVSISPSRPIASARSSGISHLDSEIELRTDYPVTPLRKSSLKPVRESIPVTILEETICKAKPEPPRRTSRRLSQIPPAPSPRPPQLPQSPSPLAPPAFLMTPKEPRASRKPRFQEGAEVIKEDLESKKIKKQPRKLSTKSKAAEKAVPRSILSRGREGSADAGTFRQVPGPSEEPTAVPEPVGPVSSSRKPSLATATSSTVITRKKLSKYEMRKRKNDKEPEGK